ncbi:2-oxoadipate dehydrogenase E1 component [Acrasis kona]|uniref:2-oxoadipate dehydrogenase E1 component n=1 Tax=Acrasis kona TaxID=1008807 RepID=A0AAW2Z1J1_9EUKA
MENQKEINWLGKKLEASANVKLTDEELKRFHRLIVESEAFDHFMAKKFPTVKRYGLEGTETMIPAMDIILRKLEQDGTTDLVLGMPHRGRLNLLVGLLKYPPRALFHKMKGNSEIPEELFGIGDVLSHIGISTKLPGTNMNISLLNNPSHLEAINPVALGKTRNKIDKGRNASCVQMHGDAAFIGQGIVAETLCLSKLPHFQTGGTIHIVLDNQLGFTTPSLHSRSTRYSGDVGKMTNAPILSVNAEKIHDVSRVMTIATEYKNKFKKDVIVEIKGYRRHGHNELDEPAFTQPKMYKAIRSRETFPKTLTQTLISQGVIAQHDSDRIKSQREEELESEFKFISDYKPEKVYFLGDWERVKQASDFSILQIPKTGVDVATMKQIIEHSVRLPQGFNVHPRLEKYHVQSRLKSCDRQVVDWSAAETLAFGTLLCEGYNVRLSGQDVARGTFSHRHLEFVDQVNEDKYVPLQHLPKKNAKLEIVTSNLSEFAVMGFEYGYSINDPNNMVIWEAQFGDFNNGAQIMIDQFIASGEDKWCLSTGITLLLPHGMDGAGPEHSSGRLERFLQMCDSDINTDDVIEKRVNMCVINPSTPANYFHALRRQMHRKFRKPLIVMSPKQLLRLSNCVSDLSEMATGTSFKTVLPDVVDPSKSMRKIIFCSGKIFLRLDRTEEGQGIGGIVCNRSIGAIESVPVRNVDGAIGSLC